MKTCEFRVIKDLSDILEPETILSAINFTPTPLPIIFHIVVNVGSSFITFVIIFPFTIHSSYINVGRIQKVDIRAWICGVPVSEPDLIWICVAFQSKIFYKIVYDQTC